MLQKDFRVWQCHRKKDAKFSHWCVDFGSNCYKFMHGRKFSSPSYRLSNANEVTLQFYLLFCMGVKFVVKLLTLRMFEDRCPGEYLDLRGKMRQEAGEKCCIICTLHQILLYWSNQGGPDGWDMQHALGHKCLQNFGWTALRDYSCGIGVDGRKILKLISGK
jgi:hypothetical protein